MAATIQETFGNIGLPEQLKNARFSEEAGQGTTNFNIILDNVIGLFFAAASVAFVIMFVWGAVQMIVSGGDKEAMAKAKSKITWSIVGVALLALSYLIFFLLQTITGFEFFARGP